MIGRIPVTHVEPVVSCGDYPAKAVAGESFTVAATVFREGHDAVAANVVLTDPRGVDGPYTPMHPVGVGIDRWEATVRPTGEGDWTYRIEAWADPVGSWHHDAGIKIPAGQDVDLVCEEGALLFTRAAKQLKGKQRKILESLAATLRDDNLTPDERLRATYADDVTKALATNPLRDLVTSSPSYKLQVDRERALVGAWYEFFPRSEGTFKTAAAKRLPAIAKMGFDVVYLPPIHPIGKAYRKGPNNTLEPGPDDVGVPWAIGSAAGGHDAVHPDLGTIEDFDHFVETARTLRMEIALDFALQCSPDHPWVTRHP